MAKEDLLAEAASLGIEGLDSEFTNKKIQAAIDAARAADDGFAEEPAEEQAEEVAEEQSDAPEPKKESTFTLEQLKPFSKRLFGVGSHVLVGAASAGTIPEGKVTRAQVASGVERYLNMPIEKGAK